jgi:hypothetical protein
MVRALNRIVWIPIYCLYLGSGVKICASTIKLNIGNENGLRRVISQD